MKNAWIGIGILLLLTSAFPATAAAEFYRYKDAHGNVIYTDDLSKVPVDKRPQAKMYEEGQSSAPAQEAPAAAAPSKDATAELQQESLRLQKVQQELNQEYDGLVKENTELKTAQSQAVTPEQIKEVNKKVVSFNARFKAYQEKESAYKVELKAYNEKALAEQGGQPE